MKFLITLFISTIFLLSACKNKKEKNKPGETAHFISAISIIKEEIRNVDTSLFMIVRMNLKDTVYGDTQYIRREDFATQAKEFLDLPDIADPKISDSYTQETMYDDDMKRVVFTYLPKDAKNALIQRQELVIQPDPLGGESKVENIIIETSTINRDSSERKILLWQTNRSFQVTRIVQRKAEPETTHTYKVSWNDSAEE